MPTFDFTSPEGKSYTVEGPDGATAEQAFAMLNQHLGQVAPQQSAPVSASGLAKAGLTGVAQGGIGIAGMPGDMSSLINSGLAGIESLLGRNPEAIAKSNAAYNQAPSLLPTSDAIQKAVEAKTGQFYQPQNAAENFVNTAGQFAPLIASGPGGLARRALTNVAAPAIGSEIAGQLTAGTPAEPFARAAGAILSGAGASKLGRIADAKSAFAAAPTAEALDIAKTAAYQHPDVTTAEFKQNAIDALTKNLDSQLLASKVDKFVAPTVMGIVDRLEKPRFGPTHTAADLDLARQSLSDVPYQEKRAASIVRNGIDNFLATAPQGALLAGDAAKLNAKILEARALHAAQKRDEDISNAMGRAENQAGSTYSGSNLENATRQQLRPILNEKTGVAKRKGFQDYTDQEIAAARRAVNGTTYGNLVRDAAKYLGGGGGLGGALTGFGVGEAAHQGGADPLSSFGIGIAAALGAKGLNRYGARLATNRANELGAMLRSRSPLGIANGSQQAIAALQNSDSPFAQAILRAIMARQNGLNLQQPALAAP